jgi:hypothetical protein
MTAPKKTDPRDLQGALLQELDLHPYRTVAIAAGIGYLLGTRLAGPLVAVLSRSVGPKLASSLLGPLLDTRA